MFTKRLVSGIILVILAIIIVGKGGALLYGVTALISLIGLFELYRVLKIEKNDMGVVGYIQRFLITDWYGSTAITM